MKLREKKELRSKTDKELKDLLKEKDLKIQTLEIEKNQNKLKNLREIFTLRKDVARIKTFLRERELAEKIEVPVKKEEVSKEPESKEKVKAKAKVKGDK